MRQDEFIERHGQDAWSTLVAPRQSTAFPRHIRTGANILIDAEIGERLRDLGLRSRTLREAQAELNIDTGSPDWREFLVAARLSGSTEEIKLDLESSLAMQRLRSRSVLKV